MSRIVMIVFWCVFLICLFDCRGSPIPDPQVNQAILENEAKDASMSNLQKIQQLYSLFNESLLIETLSQVSILPNLQNEDNPAMPPNVLSVQTSTERLYTSKPNFGFSDEDNLEPQESRLTPQKLGISLPLEQSTASQEGGQELLSKINITKSPLEYQSPKPSFASAPGGISGGHLGQLIPSGDQLPSGPPVQTVMIKDRVKETTTSEIAQELSSETPSTKSPLEYQSLRPTYAGGPGGISGGHLGQLIPSGDPLPAGPSVQTITIEDRPKETTTSIQEVSSEKPNTKSPLEYQSQKPSYASAPGGISGGHLGQLIPSGDPLPAGPLVQTINLADRLKDPTTTITVQEVSSETPNTKSPLEYQSEKPSYASAPGGISGGHLGQLIPSGDPLPAGPLVQTINLADRLKDPTTTITVQEVSSETPNTKSPLEYQSEKPSYASAPGGISGGHLGQLIPSGDPLPAGPLVQTINLADRHKDPTTTITVQEVSSETPNTKSPLEYQSEKPSYASAPGGISGGHLGQLIPSGDPLPAGPLVQMINLADRLKDPTTTITVQEVSSEKPNTKSPLEYQSQKPSYASAPGGISGGHLGQLIPLGDPLPAGTLVETMTTQDRVKETTTITMEKLPSPKPSTKQPWFSFPGILEGIFGGQFGQLIPPGNQMPDSFEKPKPDIGDRFQETSTITSSSSTTIRPSSSTKSPLEYQNQKPSYAGGISGGNWGPLIPPGKPWPADPVTKRPTIVDRFKETTTTTSQQLSTQKPSTKSPLEYQTQRPSFAGIPGGISGGHLDTLIPPGKPWPSDTQTQRPVLEDRFKETTTITTIQERPSQKPIIQSPLEYEHQKPSFAGSISGGHIGQLIPPGKPWPANPVPPKPLLEDRFKETTIIPVQPSQSPQTPTKLSIAYTPQKPSFAGQLSSGYFGQLLPPGKPWPASK